MVYDLADIYTGLTAMVRVQLHLDEDNDHWLEARADQLGTSKSALVREAIAEFRTQTEVSDPGIQDRLREPLHIEGFSDDDPEVRIVGWIKSAPGDPTDVAKNHDKYLIEAELERWRRSR
ncbi:MAG: hypothetical protein QOF51_656 [Chloroflexota bacterium]|jgi:predicted transcriptional regulator|nr:hypothetical protein [Chloroflexota bacterium]